MGYSIFNETMIEMPWTEIEKAAGEGAIVLLPVGIIEEHGPHMGLAVDTYTAYLMSILTRRDLEAGGIKTLIAPPQYWGISEGTATFGGTFSVRKETMKALIYDILASLHRWGLNRVFTINWHADYRHCKAILEAVSEARNSFDIDALSVITASDIIRFRLNGDEGHILVQQSPPSMTKSSEFADYHAGSLETGIMVQYYPDDVDVKLAESLPDSKVTDEDLKVLRGSDEEIRQVIPDGYFGNPAGYDVEKARQFIALYASDLANTISGYIEPR